MKGGEQEGGASESWLFPQGGGREGNLIKPRKEQRNDGGPRKGGRGEREAPFCSEGRAGMKMVLMAGRQEEIAERLGGKLHMKSLSPWKWLRSYIQ